MIAAPSAPSLPKHLWWDLLWWDTDEECLPTCWELWEVKEFPSNKVPSEYQNNKSWVHLSHVPQGTWIEPELQLEKETHKSPDMSKGGWKHWTLRLLEVVNFPQCNRLDIHWYVRMPTDAPQLTQSWNAAQALWGRRCHSWTNLSWEIVSFHIEIGRCVCWNNSNNILVSQIQNVAG